MISEFEIKEALRGLVDPLTKKDIIAADLVQGLTVSPLGKVSLVLDVNTEFMNEGIKLKEKIISCLEKLPGISNVQVALTAQRKPKAHNPSKMGIPGVKHIVAVGSGKGGVGKSTTAVNLACALQQMNLKVGILDGDIYGPSLPRLLGCQEKPTSDDKKTINPIEVYGLKCMSMGFMMAETVPAIWRGPMIQTAFLQMLRQVNWGELDILVIDLPPGTGDVHLTLAQNVLLSGAIIVSTPQDLALVDARRGVEMFSKVGVPILGFVENMSYFLCPHCYGRSEIFEHGGVHKEAEALGVPLLAEVPLHISIREASEQGKPLAFFNSELAEAMVYQSFARTVWSCLSL